MSLTDPLVPFVTATDSWKSLYSSPLTPISNRFSGAGLGELMRITTDLEISLTVFQQSSTNACHNVSLSPLSQ